MSTRAADPKAAGEEACRKYDEARFRLTIALPAFPKSLASAAEAAIVEMEKAIAAGRQRGTKAFKDYIGALKGYFIPYFGQKPIDRITNDDLLEFATWRRKKLGRNPKKSTLSNHNAALRRVFKLAVAERWMSALSVPVIPATEAAPGERRPAFSDEEVDSFDQLFTQWLLAGEDEGWPKRTTQIRELLLPYVMFVLATGVRPGTETRNLRWRDIRERRLNGVEYVTIVVSGKTGRRELVASHELRVWLESPALSHPQSKPDLGKPVFALPDGTEPRDLHGAFEAFLKWANLLYDPDSGLRRSLYSLRHTYATRQILRGIDLHVLALQMGTSIAMLERHYSHLEPIKAASRLAGAQLQPRAAGGWALTSVLDRTPARP